MSDNGQKLYAALIAQPTLKPKAHIIMSSDGYDELDTQDRHALERAAEHFLDASGDQAKKDLQRHRLPDERPAITVKRRCGQHELYVTVGFYDEEGWRIKPAEVFVKVSKHGDVISGLLDGIAVTISLALQYGVEWEAIRTKYERTQFGAEDDRDSSLLDGLQKAVTQAIEQRKSVIGEE